jgi:hypothetical protein
VQTYVALGGWRRLVVVMSTVDHELVHGPHDERDEQERVPLDGEDGLSYEIMTCIRDGSVVGRICSILAARADEQRALLTYLVRLGNK